MITLRNDTGYEFIDISSEICRRYHFSGEYEEVVEIWEPLWLSVRESGAARILDGAGICHYIPSGWLHLEWQVREGQPHFVK